MHPSIFEGASTVILEALYYGCNVVSFTVPAENMSEAFVKVASKEEMISVAGVLLQKGVVNKSVIVNTSGSTSRALIKLLNSNI